MVLHMESTELDLGSYYPCLNVETLTESMEFYLKLGFIIREDHRDENWAVLMHNNMVLCLYQGHIDTNLINFRGGDIREGIQARRQIHKASPHRARRLMERRDR